MKDPRDRHEREFKIRLTDAQAQAVLGLAGILDMPPAVYLRRLIVYRLNELATHRDPSVPPPPVREGRPE